MEIIYQREDTFRMTDAGVKEEDFSKVKTRMDAALASLRQELVSLQEQDLSLLRQLMTIQQTIHMLHATANSRALLQRSYSTSGSSNLPPQGPPILPSHDPQAQPSPPAGLMVHAPLCRVQSAPLERQPTEESIEDEGPETDELAWSYDAGDGVPLSKALTEELYDTLTPLPVTFTKPRRILNHNVTPGQMAESRPPPRVLTEMEEQVLGQMNTQIHQKVRNEDVLLPVLEWCINVDANIVDDHHHKLQNTHDLRRDLTDRGSPKQENNRLGHKDRSSSPPLSSSFALGTKMAPAHCSHYKNILKRSSQIWKQIRQEQEMDGHVDAKKVAALQLFL